MKDSNIVVMDNKMVIAKYGKLTDVESRFIFFAISQINYADTEFRTFKFSLGKLLKELGMPGKNHKFLLTVLKRAMEKSIVIPDGKGGAFVFPWFRQSHLDKTGMVEAQFNDALKPYLLELRQNFTKAELVHILGMKTHTRRIYLMCKQYLNLGYFEKKIVDIRDELELGDAYKEYKYMARNIIGPALKEINKLSDIRVSIKPIRAGRSYTALGVKVAAVPSHKVLNKGVVAGKRTEEMRIKDTEDKAKRQAESDRATAERDRAWQDDCRGIERYLTRKTKQWQECLKTIETILLESQYHTWFVVSELFMGSQHDAYLLVPHNMAADHVSKHHLDVVKRAFAENKIKVATIRVVTPNEIERQFQNVVEVDMEEDLDEPCFFLDSEPTSFL